MARKACPTDLTDEQWWRVEPFMPAAKPGGRPRSVDLREAVNAVLYLNRNGCHWRALPHDLPPWGTVHWFYRRVRLDGVWDRVHDQPRERVVVAGKEPTPSAAVIDGRSVKTTETGGVHGYDAGKKVNGRKRHLAVDTLGLIIAVVVAHAAGVQDRDRAKRLMGRTMGGFGRPRLIWADGGYAAQRVRWAAGFGGWTLEVVKRTGGPAGFELMPHRWVVERTFAWLERYRRHSKDYEYLTASSEAQIKASMLHRLSPG